MLYCISLLFELIQLLMYGPLWISRATPTIIKAVGVPYLANHSLQIDAQGLDVENLLQDVSLYTFSVS